MLSVDNGPTSLPWMRWQSQSDIIGDQPILITIKCANLKYIGIFLAFVILILINWAEGFYLLDECDFYVFVYHVVEVTPRPCVRWSPIAGNHWMF